MKKIIYALLMLLTLATALADVPNPGHSANQVGPGTFPAGNYSMQSGYGLYWGNSVNTNQHINEYSGDLWIGRASPGAWLKLDKNGNIGIGTPNPAQTLDISSTGGETGIQITNKGTTGTRTPLIRFAKGTADKWGLLTGDSGDGLDDKFYIWNYINSPAGVAQMTFDTNGDVEVAGKVMANAFCIAGASPECTTSWTTGGGFWTRSGATLSPATADDSVAVVRNNGNQISLRTTSQMWDLDVNANDNYFKIRDMSISGGPARLVIDKSGNVGIGTTPGATLDIAGSNVATETTPHLKWGYGGYFKSWAETGALNLIGFVSDSSNWNMYIGLKGGQSSYGYGKLIFRTGTSSSYADRMTIDQNGNVGIGTTNPQAKLDVRDTARAMASALDLYKDGTQIREFDSLGVQHFYWWLDVANNQLLLKGAPSSNVIASFNNNGNVGIGTASSYKDADVQIGSVRKIVLGNTGGNHVPFYGEYIGFHTAINLDDAHFIKLAGGTATGGDQYGGGLIGTDYVGNMYFYAFNTADNVNQVDVGAISPRVTITNTGNVGIGTLSPGEKLDVNGNIRATGTITPSDERLKTDIKPISNVLDKLLQLNGVSFVWKNDETKKQNIGLIAQDVEKEFPEVVSTSEDGYKGIDYSKLTPILIEAVKELKAENDALKQRVEALEAK